MDTSAPDRQFAVSSHVPAAPMDGHAGQKLPANRGNRSRSADNVPASRQQ